MASREGVVERGRRLLERGAADTVTLSPPTRWYKLIRQTTERLTRHGFVPTCSVGTLFADVGAGERGKLGESLFDATSARSTSASLLHRPGPPTARPLDTASPPVTARRLGTSPLGGGARGHTVEPTLGSLFQRSGSPSAASLRVGGYRPSSPR